MSNKRIIGGFIIEVFLFFATGFAYAHGSLLWILFLILGFGWAYRVGQWIQEEVIEREAVNNDFAQKLIDEARRKREEDKEEGEKLLEEWK